VVSVQGLRLRVEGEGLNLCRGVDAVGSEERRGVDHHDSSYGS